MVLASRGEQIAAVASVAGVLYVKEDFEAIKAKPIFHVAGKKDETIKYQTQIDTIEFMKKINKCEKKGKKINENIIEYSSSIGMPVITYIHNGGHEIVEDANKYIIEFFKKN